MIRSFLPWTTRVAVVVLTCLASPSLADTTSQPWHVGINFAGAEFGKKRPGTLNKDYAYPKKADMDYFLDQGFTTIRLPFRWERIQRTLGGAFEPEELSEIDKVVTHVTGKGAYVLLDPHNYAKYYGNRIGSSEVPVTAFASFWAELAKRYKDNPRVLFGLMNEPNKIRADDWRRAADAAIAAIRATGARNLILVPGTRWTGAHSWLKSRGGISNAAAFRNLTDPENNIAFEVHQYLDSNYSGTHDTCQNEAIGEKSLEKFTQWARDNKYRALLGEFGAADNAVCLEALDRMLKYVRANSDVWLGWTYWAAGSWWKDKYRFNVHPSPKGPRPQMKVLQRHINPS